MQITYGTVLLHGMVCKIFRHATFNVVDPDPVDLQLIGRLDGIRIRSITLKDSK
jgi:hypothetical protein